MNKSNRDTIALEGAEILKHSEHAANQWLLQVQAPAIARRARAGSFAHIRCSAERPMRRPVSIMRADPHKGTVEFLYKVLGEGTRLLSQRRVGETLGLIGPIGRPFALNPDRRRPLLIGGGVGMPPMVFLADAIRSSASGYEPLVILGSEVPFPFDARPSQIMVPGIPDGAIATMPLLEDWGIASRLASLRGYAGCFEGYVTELAGHWLEALDADARQEVAIFACGPHPMLEAVAGLANEYNLPCQVSLEEFMACGVGGCAGCVVEVQTENGPSMQRVCVDGPVFDAATVFG